MLMTTTKGFFAGIFAVVVLSSGQQIQAKETGCPGGGFTILANLAGNADKGTIAANGLPATFTIRGKYVEFDVDAATFGVRNYALTGEGGADSLTGGPRVILFAGKIPDHRGLTLTSDVSYELKDGALVLQRTGAGLSMKIQANDCPTGGIFQMESARGDSAATDITHTLGAELFYFNNPNFSTNAPNLPLCPAGGPFTPACTPVPITPRINFATDFAPKLVGRDSPQVATKLSQTGGTSVWRVSTGGRMGGVLGEDSVEVAPPATACTSHCGAQNQVKGKYPVLGFPFPVPAASRITPR